VAILSGANVTDERDAARLEIAISPDAFWNGVYSEPDSGQKVLGEDE
jgi:hypothetical protein